VPGGSISVLAMATTATGVLGALGRALGDRVARAALPAAGRVAALDDEIAAVGLVGDAVDGQGRP